MWGLMQGSRQMQMRIVWGPSPWAITEPTHTVFLTFEEQLQIEPQGLQTEAVDSATGPR